MRIALVICFLLLIALLGLNTASAQSPDEVVTAQAQLAAATNDAQNVRLLGHIGGSVNTAFISGNRGYLGQGKSVTILDTTQPANLKILGRTPPLADSVSAIVVQNNIAYVAAGSAGLHLFEISDPAKPLRLGFYATPGYATDIFVIGSIAYIAAGDSGLRVINVASPDNPTEIGFYDTTGSARSIFVVGPIAYIADGNYLQVVNIANPALPSLIISYSISEVVLDVYVIGNYAYLAAGDVVSIVNVANPSKPSEVGVYSPIEWAVGIFVVGNYAYVADADAGLSVLNVTDPTRPSNAGFFRTQTGVDNIFVAGNYAYVTERLSSLRVIDISQPAQLMEIGFYDTPVQAYDVSIANNYAYVAAGDRLRVVNVANPITPNVVGSYDTPGWAQTVVVADNYAYVNEYDNGLQVLTLANPTAPTYVSTYHQFGNYQRIYLFRGYAYVADGALGLRVLSLTNPALLNEASFYLTPGSALDVYVTDYSYAFVAAGDSGLRILNVSNPASPSEIGFYDTPGFASGIYISGNYAYVADGNSGLRVINISNAITPSEVGFFDTLGSASDVYVSGNYAYVSDGDSGLRVINISNPTAPNEVGFFDTPEATRDVKVVGNVIYLASGDDGLYLLRYPACYRLNLKYTGSGGIPVLNPANSTGCGANEYLPGTLVTLSANPAPRWRITSWLGTNNDNSTSTNNTLTMPATDHEVTVNYAPVCYSLTLTHSGSGSDPVTTPTNSQGCSAGQFAAGETINLQATPTAGHAVSSWSGTTNDSSTANQNMLTMPARNHAVSVAYIQVCHRLTLTHTGSGTDPTATPTQSADCPLQSYRAGAAITLHASPGAGYTIGSWSGTANNSSIALDNSLTMPNGDHTASVVYTLISVPLTITPSATEIATLTITPTPTDVGTDKPTPTDTPTPTPPDPTGKKKWTMLLYLAGDTGRIDGGTVFGELRKALRRLESNPNPDVNVVALLDGPNDLDSYRVTFTPQLRDTPLGEVPMDDPLTLVNFVKQAQADFPAEHYYLVIADHANGVQGIAWDTTTAPNKTALLTPAKLEQALQQISNDGADPIDVVHFDGCSFGLLENVAMMHNYADYLVLSQNIGWSVFGYDQYRATLTATTTPREFALAVAQGYGQTVASKELPYTISAIDPSQTGAAIIALNGLADALRNYIGNDVAKRTAIENVRSQSQKFDSTRPLLEITNDDWYVDLVDFATKLQAQALDPQISATASALIAALQTGSTPLVLYEAHLTASIDQTSTENCVGDHIWQLDNAHGISIYYPPRGGGGQFTRYTNGDTFAYFNSQSQWDEFLQGGIPPLAPGEPPPDDMMIPLAPCSSTQQTPTTQLKLFLPIVRR